FESAVQNALAPLAPRVLLHDVNPTLLGGAFQIMQRVPGSALLLGEIGQDVRGLGILRPLLGGFRDAVFGPWPQLLAATHARLHALSPEPVLRALDAAGLRPRLRLGRRVDRVETGVEELALKGMRPVVAWLREREPHLPGRRRLCHGDLFPNQVFARDGAVTGVIDWADATLAPGEFDVAQVCAGIETLPLGIPGLDALQQHLVRRFRESYARLRPMDPEALRFGEVLRAAATLVALARYRAGKGPAPVPYDGRGGERKLVAHLARNNIQARLD
ncbi:MAG: phosphotransferase, partial [Myxococcota bacterium]